jgi:hypothetical protein
MPTIWRICSRGVSSAPKSQGSGAQATKALQDRARASSEYRRLRCEAALAFRVQPWPRIIPMSAQERLPLHGHPTDDSSADS